MTRFAEIRPTPKKRKIQDPAGDRLLYAFIHVVMILLLIVTTYPLIYVLSASFSSPRAVGNGQVVLWPVEFSLRGYQEVFEYQVVWLGYKNTIFYTLVGTVINVVMTMMAAFALSKKTLPGRGMFTFLFTFTMLFSGGLVPTYLQLRSLGIVNTRWSLLLPGAISVYNMVVTRTFIQNIPGELSEAAEIDGCSHFKYFFLILLPLSKAILAVISLYYAVGHWNSYFNALIYISDRNLYPLQIFLRDVLVLNSVDPSSILDPEEAQALEGMRDLLKFSMIVVSTVPILCIYPAIQKYFAKGVMVGSLKG
ncbi:MAG: carbohydrate ABC transporter permease [Clostridiales bacterium]|nr:carbohydrate ABC transporter permease [Clostridiales bacterium]